MRNRREQLGSRASEKLDSLLCHLLHSALVESGLRRGCALRWCSHLRDIRRPVTHHHPGGTSGFRATRFRQFDESKTTGLLQLTVGI